jgi:hypothetical protein
MSDLAEPVIGFRFWNQHDGELRPYRDFASVPSWRPGVNEATCDEPHQPPTMDCECGLHSFYTLDALLSWLNLRSLTQDRPDEVFGVTRSWGRVAVFGESLAAQFSEIIALADSRADPDGLRALAASYGVPLIGREGLVAWAAEFGGTVPPQLRPQPAAEFSS